MPFSEWFKGPLLLEAEALILDGKLVFDGYLDRKKLEVLLKGHRECQYDLSKQIWQWLCLPIWFELHTQLRYTSPIPPAPIADRIS
jgi:Asparagine synthase